MKGGSCTSCLPQTGGACPCQLSQANPAFGGSRRTHKKNKSTHKKNKKRNNKYAMLCTCKLKRLRTRTSKRKHPSRK